MAIWAKLLLTIGWTYAVAVVLGKLCILGIYLRLFQTKVYRAITWALCAIVLLISLVGGITGTFGCRPISFLWNPTIPGGHCINVKQFLKWMTFPNILTDIVILVLPVKIAWSLDLPRPQKVALTVTFSAGLVGVIAAMLRFLSFFQADVDHDGTFWSVEFLTWTIIEPGLYLVSACLLLFRPLIQQVILGPLKRFTSKFICRESGYDGHELRSFQCIGKPEDLAALSTCAGSEGKEGFSEDLEGGKEPIAQNAAVGTLFEKVLTGTGQEVYRAAQKSHGASSTRYEDPNVVKSCDTKQSTRF
ncbi:MAG: hypothetical protein LQ351_004929 [Letrouitia transgressa]|nr:MAG: hypothetical protein LQ351_004929 [Letrouitia transgressa]